MTGSALDRLLPQYHFVERHSLLVQASRHDVWSALHEVGAGEMALTETRVAVEDRSARRRFAVYWAVIRFGSGLIRRDLLRAVRRRAERDSTGSTS